MRAVWLFRYKFELQKMCRFSSNEEVVFTLVYEQYSIK